MSTVARRPYSISGDISDSGISVPTNAGQSKSTAVPAATVGEGANYLLEQAEVTIATHEGVPLYVELPTSVVLEITYTEPGLQGDRSTGGNKPATVETGATVMVPLFITNGEKIKVDTRDGRYLGRA